MFLRISPDLPRNNAKPNENRFTFTCNNAKTLNSVLTLKALLGVACEPVYTSNNTIIQEKLERGHFEKILGV